jgi:peptidoglycan/xylan/chitin deacetylase (PgdA/CDA1 family)
LRSRRNLALLVASRLGLFRALRMMRRGHGGGLLVLAYHRIGTGEACPVDEGTFSASREQLASQVRLVERWARLAHLDEVEELYASGRRFDQPLVLLTFDDVYRDNYTAAFPVLKAAGATAVFFVPTGLLERAHVPWWDRIAYAVKHSRCDACRLSYPDGMELTGLRTRPQTVVLELQTRCKQDAGLDTPRFVEAIESAAGASARELGELLAGWNDLREMVEGGMVVASHTHTHRPLGHLSYAEQYEELERSRFVLRKRVGVDTRAVAYPFGKRSHFNDDTRRAMTELGYRLGFSHYNGWNPRPGDPFDIRRIPIEPTISDLSLEGSLAVPELLAA